jgi:outer membrane protein
MHLLFESRGKRQSVPSSPKPAKPASAGNLQGFRRLQAGAAIAFLLLSTVPQSAAAQQTGAAPAPTGVPTPSNAPNSLIDLHPTSRDFSVPRGYWKNPFGPYIPTTVESPITVNSTRLEDLAKGGKIYLSLSNAIVLALENNYDIAIQRYNLDIADTDILRAKAGAATLLGAPSGLVENTLGGANSLLQASGGGPGGSSAGTGGVGAGTAGQSLTTSGLGPSPEVLDPLLSGTIQLQRQTFPTSSSFQGSLVDTNTDEYNFTYTQGWITGTQLQVAFDNSRVATNQPFVTYSPALNANFLATVTQHLAYGFGPGINKRFIIQAKNDRKISDAGFRLQILYTVNQIENIYVGLVSAYEDVQSKQRALEQSKQLAADNRKQLQIGTMAPLDVVQSDSNVASDQQALVASQSALEYQQLVMKQAIARNLNDPLLASAPVIPTDRISILETPEERMPVDDLVKEANANRPDVQQVLLGLKNDEITVRALRNGLLPQVDLYAFYGGYGVGGARGPNCTIFNAEFQSVPCTEETTPTIDYSHTFQNLFNNSGPNKGVGLTINIPIRNRQAQSAQLRSMLEYRQAQLQVQQIYLKVRMQVINGQYALTNDRAQVESAQAAADYNQQSLDSEEKKYHLGASTTANVLLQQRNLSNAENNLITARATYAKDRAAMTEILGTTLDRYGISLEEAVTGNVKEMPVIPGLEPATPKPEAQVPNQQQRLQQEQTPPAATPPMPPQPTTQQQTPPTPPQ